MASPSMLCKEKTTNVELTAVTCLQIGDHNDLSYMVDKTITCTDHVSVANCWRYHRTKNRSLLALVCWENAARYHMNRYHRHKCLTEINTWSWNTHDNGSEKLLAGREQPWLCWCHTMVDCALDGTPAFPHLYHGFPVWGSWRPLLSYNKACLPQFVVPEHLKWRLCRFNVICSSYVYQQPIWGCPPVVRGKFLLEIVLVPRTL